MTLINGILVGQKLITDSIGEEGVEVTIRVYAGGDGYNQLRNHPYFGPVTATITPRK